MSGGVIFSYDLTSNTYSDIHDFTSGSAPDGGFILYTTPEGLPDLTPKVQLGIYPDPASDMINLTVQAGSHQKVELNFLNMAGQKVLSFSGISISGNFTQTFDIRKFQWGQYFIELIIDGNKTVRKFSKE